MSNEWYAMNLSIRSFVGSAIALMLFTGCQRMDPAEGESHEHFPPHWPQTIFQASARLNEFVEREDPTSTNHNIPSRQELIDLVGWLPILAADSDLDRATFDRIDAETAKITTRWERAAASKDAQALVNEPEVRELITWLAEVCQREQTRIDLLEQ